MWTANLFKNILLFNLKAMSENKMSVLRPLGDHIVVEAVNETETVVSGLIIPDTVSKEKPQKGRVLFVGPGKVDNNGNRVAMEVKVNDTVIFSKYGPTEFKVDGRSLLILSQSDILAILE